MLGAKKINVLSTLLVLGGVSMAHADLKPQNAIYPVVCGDQTLNRTASTRVCFNKVAGTNLEVFSISKLRNGQSTGTSYYLVTYSYDLKRATTDGLAQVIVPARRVKKLESLETIAPGEGEHYTRIKSVKFTQAERGLDAQHMRIDPRKELILSEDSIDTEVVRNGDVGLALKPGSNWEEGFSLNIENLEPVAQTRGLGN